MTEIDEFMIEKCPECEEKIEILPIREPLKEEITAMTMNLTQRATFTEPSYSPSLKTYKCSNPKCWVTKITESWE